MPLEVPPHNADGSLRYYDDGELAQIGFKPIGVAGEGDHMVEDFGPDGSGATRRYSCAYEERYAAALVLAGYTESYTDGSGGTRISRLLPDSHPEGLKYNWCCSKVRVSPYRFMGTTSETDFGQPLPDFDRAKLEATYELLPYLLRDDDELDPDLGEFERYVIKPGHPGAEVTSDSSYIGLPGGILNFVTADGSPPDGTPIPYPVGFVENVTNNVYLWHRVPKTVWGKGAPLYDMVKGTAADRGYIGALNAFEFDGHPPLTLQLRAADGQLRPDPSGLGYAWDIVYKMAEKSVPFGHLGYYFFNPADGTKNGYYQVLTKGNSHTRTPEGIAGDDRLSLFIARDFADLFKPGGA